MFLDDLPHTVLYNLCKYLSFLDIINVSKTCEQLFQLIERNDYFWMKLIENQFGFDLYHRYAHQLFQNKRNSDYNLYNTEEDREKFLRKFRRILKMNPSTAWFFNVLNCKDTSDAYLAYQRIEKQRSSPRTNQMKMSLTINELFEYYLSTNKYLMKENLSEISLYKLIYVYLIKPKRLSCLESMPVFLGRSQSKYSSSSSQTKFAYYELDIDSSTGQRVRLDANDSTLELGVKGTFQSILPGIYQIFCRIKLDKNEQYFSYYTRSCREYPQTDKSVQCHFYALPDYGIDCRCNEQILNYDWFESNYLLYENKKWFNQLMGQIQVFHLSNIYFGFKIISGYRYRSILFDYIELNPIQ